MSTQFLPKGKVRPADKLQIEAAQILPLDGLARSKQDPINRGHSAHYLHRPPAIGGHSVNRTGLISGAGCTCAVIA